MSELNYATVFTISELQETKTSEYHRISHSPLDYRILLMDEDQDRIYVGSKDHILSLNINNISQDPLSVSSSFILRIFEIALLHAFLCKTKKIAHLMEFLVLVLCVMKLYAVPQTLFKTGLFAHFEAIFCLAWPHKENLCGLTLSTSLQDKMVQRCTFRRILKEEDTHYHSQPT